MLSNISGVTTMLDLNSLKAHNRMIYQLSPKNADEGGLMGENEDLAIADICRLSIKQEIRF